MRLLLALPAGIVLLAFFLVPLAALVAAGGDPAAYGRILTDPRYLASLANTAALSAVVTLATLLVAGVAGAFLARERFAGRGLLVSLLTLPLAFPGVVVGGMVIMLAGRQGFVAQATDALFGERVVFAYSMAGLFVGYLYFSIPRVVLTVMAAAEKLDPRLEQAARSLGASDARVLFSVLLPGLAPALLAAGAICFATSMGAFGTAFTLAARINVLPMLIYTEFTLAANFSAAAALSLLLGGATWAALFLARSLGGATIAAAA